MIQIIPNFVVGPSVCVFSSFLELALTVPKCKACSLLQKAFIANQSVTYFDNKGTNIGYNSTIIVLREISVIRI